jgi:hypothetical protein
MTARSAPLFGLSHFPGIFLELKSNLLRFGRVEGEAGMKSAAVLPDYAEECLRIAGGVGTERERRIVVEMAAHWHALAQEREREGR